MMKDRRARALEGIASQHKPAEFKEFCRSDQKGANGMKRNPLPS